jgi:hypothetical protein
MVPSVASPLVICGKAEYSSFAECSTPSRAATFDLFSIVKRIVGGVSRPRREAPTG